LIDVPEIQYLHLPEISNRMMPGHIDVAAALMLDKKRAKRTNDDPFLIPSANTAYFKQHSETF
jgi:hypothetical protein